jgi:hypothetical protein
MMTFGTYILCNNNNNNDMMTTPTTMTTTNHHDDESHHHHHYHPYHEDDTTMMDIQNEIKNVWGLPFYVNWNHIGFVSSSTYYQTYGGQRGVIAKHDLFPGTCILIEQPCVMYPPLDADHHDDDDDDNDDENDDDE